MQDLMTQITTLRRPRLLIRAARIGTQTYRRDARLPRLLGYGVALRVGPTVIRLMTLEAEMNEKRESGDAGYSIAAHVDLLTAIMGEYQLLRTQTQITEAPAPT